MFDRLLTISATYAGSSTAYISRALIQVRPNTSCLTCSLTGTTVSHPIRISLIWRVREKGWVNTLTGLYQLMAFTHSYQHCVFLGDICTTDHQLEVRRTGRAPTNLWSGPTSSTQPPRAVGNKDGGGCVLVEQKSGGRREISRCRLPDFFLFVGHTGESND